MARKPNYSFEKHKKEQDRKAKKEAKRVSRLERKRGGPAADPDAAGDPDAPTPADTEETPAPVE